MFKKYFITLAIIISIVIVLSLSSNNTQDMLHPLRENYGISSYYGSRLMSVSQFHHGVDYLTPQGTKIYAMSTGTVTYSGFNYSGGYMIIILYDNGYKSMYCHLDENLLVKYGNRVFNSTCVGTVGPMYVAPNVTNGYTTGVHFHFGLYKNNESIDPLSINYKE